MADKKELDFPLTTEFNYANKGQETSATFIRLFAPSAKQLSRCSELKQAFFRASKELPQEEEAPDAKQDKEELTGSNIMAILYSSDSVKMSEVLMNARELFTCGLATVDGEEKLTKPLVDLMSGDDFEKMTGEYLVNFILRSVLDEMKSV